MHTPICRERPDAHSLVVFIHGFMGSPGQFEDLLEDAYRRGSSVCAVLLPGHGGVNEDFARYGLADWEGHLQSELDKYTGAYRKIILVGHSMGGLLALEASLNPHNCVCGLFLIAPPLKLNMGPRSAVLKLRLFTYPPSNQIKKAYMQAKSISNLAVSPGWIKPYRGLRRLMKRTARNLPQVLTPVLAIHSRYDEMVSFKSADMFYNGLCNSFRSRLTLEKSWHAYYPPEEWQTVRAALAEFSGSCLQDHGQ